MLLSHTEEDGFLAFNASDACQQVRNVILASGDEFVFVGGDGFGFIFHGLVAVEQNSEKGSNQNDVTDYCHEFYGRAYTPEHAKASRQQVEAGLVLGNAPECGISCFGFKIIHSSSIGILLRFLKSEASEDKSLHMQGVTEWSIRFRYATIRCP